VGPKVCILSFPIRYILERAKQLQQINRHGELVAPASTFLALFLFLPLRLTISRICRSEGFKECGIFD
jgi:hypothetical protein